MVFPENGLLLAGFVLAHALWSVSDLPKQELLVPLAIVETSQGRQLLRFEAATQEEAIAKGKAHVSKLGADVTAWAFAREGLVPEGSGKVDVISVDVWAKGMDKPITIIQRFEPYANRQHFRVIGVPEVVVNGVVLEQSKAQETVEAILRGTLSHSKVAPLWAGWHNP